MDRLFEIRIDPPAEQDGVGNIVQVVVDDNDGGRPFCGFGAAGAHGYADMSRFEGGRIVDPVAGHGYDLPVRFFGFDHAQFGFRKHAGKQVGLFDGFPQLGFVHLRHLGAGHRVIRPFETGLAGDGLHGL